MPPVAEAIPGILSAVSNALPSGQTVSNLANAAADSITQQQDQGATANLAPAETQQQGIEAINTLPETTKQAQLGLAKAAEQTKDILAPAGDNMQQQGNKVADTAALQQQLAYLTYQQSVKDTNAQTIKAEDQLKVVNNNATIDPNQYLGSLGIDGRTIASIGMLISGAGAGLTGQPNLAMESFQRNIDRNIQSQKENFLNQSAIYAHQRGLLQSAQDRQQLAAQAGAAAAISVLSGAQTAMQGAQAKVSAVTAPSLVPVAANLLQQKLSDAYNQYAQIHIQAIKSGDIRKTNILGAGANGAYKALTNDKAGLLPQTPARQQLGLPPQTPINPLTSIFQQESEKRNTTPKTNNSFLDAISKMGQ